MSNYATKTDLKGATSIDTSNFAAKADSVALKALADKIDTDKLKTIPGDLSKLSNTVNNVIKEIVSDHSLQMLMLLIPAN